MTTLIGQGRGLYGKVKREVAERVLAQALGILSHTSEANYRRLVGAMDKVANTDQQKMIVAWIRNWMADGNPGSLYLSRMLKDIHPNVRKNFIAKAMVNAFFRDPSTWKQLQEERGFMPPAVMLISPSMRCNYKCAGCYAANYTRNDDMDPEVVDRVITEAKEIGTRFIVMLGGEPFIYPHLLDIFKKHHDCVFQVYTNGSLIDEALATKLVELGNVAPQVSVDGFKEETDASRGPGAFDRAMRAMDILKSKGCMFAFSTVPTHRNIDVVTSDAFIDLMIQKGAMYGWYFLYMPVGKEPDVSLMPTPEDRNKLRLAVNRFRNTKPILAADFWNDAPLTGGCIAGGRIYFHVNHKGDVEPCIFCHYATHNIYSSSLVDALSAPFFAGLREMQPFSHNTLRPCPIIDHPKIMRNAIKKWGAYPTHEGAESTFTVCSQGLDEYSGKVGELYDGIWEKEYQGWAGKWLETAGYPAERLEARKKAYKAHVDRVFHRTDA
ncbi:MAG: radical SAM protein [Dehalococcoidia bacterium]|nr:radical SAM protein [Dehalococcoidia bacterium]